MERAEASETTVLGIDNVPLDLPVAGAGSRALAAFLDYLVVGVVAVVWVVGGLSLAGLTGQRGWWIAGALLLGLFVIEYGYFATIETLRRGETLGKRALGLRVVTADGARPGTAAFLVRNAVRTIDLLAGVPLMVTDPLARRLGDRLAGTLVVHAAPERKETVVVRPPRGWAANDVAVLESFLDRAAELEPERRDRLARVLAGCIGRDDPELAAAIDPAGDPVEGLRAALQAGGAGA
jgi:uncharacterized RDD family membrane protein YckC